MTSTEKITDAAEINTITRIKLAPFFDKNPDLWFIIAESQFNLHKSIKDDDKFNHTLAALPQDIALSVYDILKNPIASGSKYEALKKALIERHSLSNEKRLDNLLSSFNEIGDLSPSEFFRLMSHQAGDSALIDKELIKRIWLKRLPQSLRTSVAAWADKAIEEILPIADKIWEVSQPSGTVAEASFAGPSTKSSQAGLSTTYKKINHSITPTERQLTKELSEIKKLLTRLDLGNRGREFNRSYSRSRQRSRSGSRNNNNYCYFHNKFGNKARNCRKPCAYKTEPETSKKNLN